MLCQNCQKRVATVHFTKIVNHNKVEMYLCDQCANEKGQFSFGSPLNIADFFSGLSGHNADSLYAPAVVDDDICEKCGMSYKDFQKSGKMGCRECYNVHKEKLKPILKRLHGSVEHSGKVPERFSEEVKMSEEINRLKERLDRAVKTEEYEKAAELRDKIKALEKSGN